MVRSEAPPQVDSSVWETPVAGYGLKPGTLVDQLLPGPNLLVFLRHFG